MSTTYTEALDLVALNQLLAKPQLLSLLATLAQQNDCKVIGISNGWFSYSRIGFDLKLRYRTETTTESVSLRKWGDGFCGCTVTDQHGSVVSYAAVEGDQWLSL